MCASALGEPSSSKLGQQMNDSSSLPEEEPPEGYYAFIQSPNAEPPKVRPPPYIDSDKECHGKSTFIYIFFLFLFLYFNLHSMPSQSRFIDQ